MIEAAPRRAGGCDRCIHLPGGSRDRSRLADALLRLATTTWRLLLASTIIMDGCKTKNDENGAVDGGRSVGVGRKELVPDVGVFGESLWYVRMSAGGFVHERNVV